MTAGCRIFDVLLACLVIGLSLPLMAAVAFVIKADSCSPVLSRRIRICRNGRWIQTWHGSAAPLAGMPGNG
jgi:lipopolysaccharide/colanic/teichoic acid biosynthesis glycosyltransferase